MSHLDDVFTTYSNQMPFHHNPTSIRIPEDHPILGMAAMLPMVLHHPRANFDEENLVKLLRTSYSLSLEEKLKILGKISDMNQKQVDNLISLLVNEHEKFEFIADEFPEDVAELVDQRMKEMVQAVDQRMLLNN